jgi:hypothetical protein
MDYQANSLFSEVIILSEKDKNAMMFEEYNKNPKFK